MRGARGLARGGCQQRLLGKNSILGREKAIPGGASTAFSMGCRKIPGAAGEGGVGARVSGVWAGTLETCPPAMTVNARITRRLDLFRKEEISLWVRCIGEPQIRLQDIGGFLCSLQFGESIGGAG
jgi:hypothetical protein